MTSKFFIVTLCTVVLFAPFVSVFAQSATELDMGASVIETIMVDVETDLQVTFTDTYAGDFVVQPDISSADIGVISPATIRITGNTAEAMVDIEAEKILGESNDAAPITISQFNVLGQEASSSITIMPFAEDKSFLLVIGGKVTGGNKNDSFKGINILNINYL